MSNYNDELECANQMLEKIEKMITNRLKSIPRTESAIVSSVNENGTINIYLPGDKENIYTNIQNQSIFQDLQPGDEIEIFLKNGNFSNCWVVAKHNKISKTN